MGTSMWFAHDRHNRNLKRRNSHYSSFNRRKLHTPLAVRIGRALRLGKRAFLYSSGIALMMSTSRGTPPKPNFLLIRERISLSETLLFSSCALISSAAIPEVTRRSCSACDGPTTRLNIWISFHCECYYDTPSTLVLCTISCKSPSASSAFGYDE